MVRIIYSCYGEEIDKDKEYRTLKELMDKAKTLAEFETLMHGATGLQIAAYIEYKRYVAEQEELERIRHEELVRANHIIQRNILPYAVKREYITRNGKRMLVFRDRQTGRFISKVRRLKA